MSEEKKAIEEIKEDTAEKAEEVTGAAEEAKEDAPEKAEEVTEVAEETKEDAPEKAEEATEAAEEAKEDASEKAEEKPEMKASTAANRKKKAERREAKAARKAANAVEEKKKRPSNGLIAIMIFGVVILMFAFSWGYNYFSQPASIEEYMEESGYSEMYNDTPVSEYTTLKMKADGNTLKILFKISEDAPEEELEQYTGDEGTDYLKDLGAYFLTSMKPGTQGIGGTVKVGAKQGDEMINYVKMSYREAKKYMKEEEEEAEAEEAEAADDADDDAE